MAVMIVAHPIPTFSGRVAVEDVGLNFVGGFTGPTEVPTEVQAQLVGEGFTLNAVPNAGYPLQYVTHADLDDPDSEPSVALRAAFGALAGGNVFAGANDFDQAPTVDGVAVATTGGNTFTGNQRIDGRFSTNTASDAKQPIAVAAVLHGPDVVAAGSTRDKVVMAQAATVTGSFAGDAGSNVGFLWGQNVFLITGPNAGDGAGVTNLIGSLIEAAVSTPAGTTFAVVRGLEAHASFFGATAGATVTQMESMRVSAPSRKDGATAGTATNVYGLFVEAVTATAVGATGSALSLFVAGGVSRFGGRVDVTDTIANNGSNDLRLFAGFADTDGSSLQLLKAANGGHTRARIATASGEFQVFDGSAITWAVTRTGLPKWTAAANAQTTVGAAGAASALPATPTKYLKVVDSAGTTLVIPAYAAA